MYINIYVCVLPLLYKFLNKRDILPTKLCVRFCDGVEKKIRVS